MSRWPLRCCDNVTLTFYWLRRGKTLDRRGRHGDRCHGQLGELGGCLSWNEHQREPCKYSRHHHSIQVRQITFKISALTFTISTEGIRSVSRKIKAKSQTFVKLNCMKVIKKIYKSIKWATDAICTLCVLLNLWYCEMRGNGIWAKYFIATLV